ncbi:MAG: nucleotidyltransferase family protein, partial [Lachnospiraceae bacterium]|nr:nucleotidyltransferase family protein [Lachnospiraceae bacterium]
LPVGCIIMASGLGRRFGRNKLLIDFHGKPLISHTIEKVRNFPFAKALVVTRHEETASLCAKENIPFLLHQLPGKNDTVRLGLQKLLADGGNQTHPHLPGQHLRQTLQASSGQLTEQPLQPRIGQLIGPPLQPCAEPLIGTGISGCLFWPADQPLVSPESLDALTRTFFHFPDSICRLGYEGTAGSPILFGQKYFPELTALPEDKGGSFLAQKYPGQVKIVPARDKYELYDIDTPEDLAFLSKFR